MEFTTKENTRYFKDYSGSNNAETKLTVNGASWVIYTSKGYGGLISTNCRKVEAGKNGSYSFMMFTSEKSKESFTLNAVKATATANKIKEIHLKSLADFDAMREAGELPEGPAPIEIGQIVFTDMIQRDERNERAVYAIEEGNFGKSYKTVYLDGSDLDQDDHIRPYSEKFGIGTYYNPGEKISQDQIDDLLIKAHAAVKERKRVQALEAEIKAIEDKAEKERLSQYTKADTRKTTNVIKAYILKTFTDVVKVSVKTDFFAGGDSMHVTYHAPSEIKELESFIETFQEGRFDGMNDIYEYHEKRKPIIIDGFILQTYKYTSARHEVAEAREVREAKPAGQPIKSGSLELIQYSEKAIALFGDSRAIKEQLKAIGGRFNPRLNYNGNKAAGWIFRNEAREQVEQLIK